MTDRPKAKQIQKQVKPPSYCDWAIGHPWHQPYHDKEYGFPVKSERKLFERLAMEIMQAGLSWETVLKKRKALNAAFDGFDATKVAAYGAKETKRLLNDTGIIRNRLKVAALIHNAGVIVAMRGEGGLAKWIVSQGERPKAEWVKLFKSRFKFMGGEIVGEFLMSIGILPGAHRQDCPVYKEIHKGKKYNGSQ
jgi:DNA-3-methyladenine glycosylase I